jgi:hypothetical protein
VERGGGRGTAPDAVRAPRRNGAGARGPGPAFPTGGIAGAGRQLTTWRNSPDWYFFAIDCSGIGLIFDAMPAQPNCS